jgi:hypothetical protein
VAFVIDDQLIEIGKQRVQAILSPQEEKEEVDVLGEWVDFVVRGFRGY